VCVCVCVVCCESLLTSARTFSYVGMYGGMR
jgi:hypothetical protein